MAFVGLFKDFLVEFVRFLRENSGLCRVSPILILLLFIVYYLLFIFSHFSKFLKEYVSTMAAYRYPITVTQWHPEKPQYEIFKPLAIPRVDSAIKVSQAVSNFFARFWPPFLHHFINNSPKFDVFLFFQFSGKQKKTLIPFHWKTCPEL